jgi:hypothetical protein
MLKLRMKHLPHTTPQDLGLFRKLLALVVSITFFALALMFSVLFVAVILTVGTIALGCFWWRTRELRKLMRQHPGVEIQHEVTEGRVIEGEVIRSDNRE